MIVELASVEFTVIPFTVSVFVTSVDVIVLVAYSVGANRNKLPFIVSVVIVEQSIVEEYRLEMYPFVTEDKVEQVIVDPLNILLLLIVLVDNVVQLIVVPDRVVNVNPPALILDAVKVELTVKKFVLIVLPTIVENPMDRAEIVLPLNVELLIFPEKVVDPVNVENVSPPVVIVEPNIVE